MADSARKLAVQILRDGRTLDVDRAAKLIAEHDAEIHQFYQSGEAWTKHEAALAEHIDKLLAEARREESEWWASSDRSNGPKTLYPEEKARLAALRAASRDSGKAAVQPTGTPEERE